MTCSGQQRVFVPAAKTWEKHVPTEKQVALDRVCYWGANEQPVGSPPRAPLNPRGGPGQLANGAEAPCSRARWCDMPEIEARLGKLTVEIRVLSKLTLNLTSRNKVDIRGVS